MVRLERLFLQEPARVDYSLSLRDKFRAFDAESYGREAAGVEIHFAGFLKQFQEIVDLNGSAFLSQPLS